MYMKALRNNVALNDQLAPLVGLNISEEDVSCRSLEIIKVRFDVSRRQQPSERHIP